VSVTDKSGRLARLGSRLRSPAPRYGAAGASDSPAKPRGGRRRGPVLRPSSAEPGSLAIRDGEGFFDRHPTFYETSATSPQQWRLNLRHEAIFTQNADLFPGARVLDIASHDGRWSLAALEAGAESVVGIEARPDLVEHAAENMRSYGIEPDRYRFVSGDVFEVMAREKFEVDVVLCLGFLYHTLRFPELYARMRQTGAHHLVVDTEISEGRQSTIQIHKENVERQGNAVADEYSYDDTTLVGRPTVAAMRVLGRANGYRLEGLSDWSGLLRDNPAATYVRDYRTGGRTTVRYAQKDPT
jgi:protein-L-isoaspartate O-methyltransferase